MSYRFSSDAQFNACLFAQADRTGGGVRPFAPYARPPKVFASNGGHAPAVTRVREILWRDDVGALHRVPSCDSGTKTVAAPFAIAHASRIVTTTRGLWVIGDSDSLHLYAEDSLTRLLTVEIEGARVVDIAHDGHESVVALVEREGISQIVRIDCTGHVLDEPVELTGITHAIAMVFLRRTERYVVLAGKRHPRLSWFAKEGGAAIFGLAVPGLHPCFEAEILGSDSKEFVFLAGADGREFGGRSFVLVFDAYGNALGEVPLDAPATGVTATRDALLVTSARGLLRFEETDVVPDDAGPVQFTMVTPVLFSPDREDRRRWLRVETTASLPQGSLLEISWGATDDVETRDRLNAIANDDSLPASRRAAALMNDPELRRDRTVFSGDAEEQSGKTPYAAKLFDVSERYLWVFITASAAAGGRLPSVTGLEVLYPGRTLMEDLPAIYQREEARPNSFLRALVGVLETNTQELDTRIASMSGNLSTARAPEPWLDFVARWLGVPWDDGLALEQKRAVLSRAAVLTKSRGTRAGLEALLDALIPGTPKRYRVTDATADHGFAIVGGDSCSGTPLPAMLGGRTRWSNELDFRAILGVMRLPCPGQIEDGAWQVAGRIRIEIAATAGERKAWEPWLRAVIQEMVPLTARVELRWTTARALRSNRLDGTLTIEPPPDAHLGADAVTGVARLPERDSAVTLADAVTGMRLR